ncbi:hypothetical protein QTP88_029321 [Uroleucon formosanum]
MYLAALSLSLSLSSDSQAFDKGPVNGFEMAKESLLVNGELEQHTVVPIVGDGACLFRALSFLIHGTQDNAMEVRSLIVGHVVNNWTKFSVMSHNRNGDNYSTANEYYADMIKNETYGGLCEFIAAGCIFPFNFKVYRNGILYTKSGSNDCPVKLLRFGQDFSNGHFDAYLSTATENNTQSRIEELVDEREHSPTASSVHSNISANISLSQSSETDQSISSSLIKKRRRRARFTNYTRKK